MTAQERRIAAFDAKTATEQIPALLTAPSGPLSPCVRCGAVCGCGELCGYCALELGKRVREARE